MPVDSITVTWEVYDEYDGSVVATHTGEFDDLADFNAFAELHYADGDYAVRVRAVSNGSLVCA